MVGELKIEPISAGGTAHNIYVDGQRIRARSLVLTMEPYEVPRAEIEIIAHDIESLSTCGIDFYLHPDSIRECIQGLRFILQTDQAMRDAFIASIKSAIDDARNYTGNSELAEDILERIVGNDSI